MDEFAAAFGINDTGPAKYGQVLGSHRLLQTELDKDVGHIHSIAFFQKCDDALTKFVINGPQNEYRFSKFSIV